MNKMLKVDILIFISSLWFPCVGSEISGAPAHPFPTKAFSS